MTAPVELGCGKAWMLADGIFEVAYDPTARVELPHIQTMGALMDSLREGKPLRVLSNLTLTGATAEAREYGATAEHSARISAVAMYGDNVVGRLVVRIFMAIQRPTFTLRVFSNRAEARAWLGSLAPEQKGQPTAD